MVTEIEESEEEVTEDPIEEMRKDLDSFKRERAEWTRQLELSQMNIHRLNGVIAYLEAKTKKE